MLQITATSRVSNCVCGLGIVFSNRLILFAEEGIYADPVVFTRTTPYQRIVVTRWRDDLRLAALHQHAGYRALLGRFHPQREYSGVREHGGNHEHDSRRRGKRDTT